MVSEPEAVSVWASAWEPASVVVQGAASAPESALALALERVAALEALAVPAASLG